ncbi:protein serine/threonine phosphatase 2C [Wolfiporia cocos MD-104 SS10]|uniref:Protein serine/threonine phosphatase 2C n=1 Tax=Wolfiporia cocos (strain MD-104) TaxID=742152 RepID=A0A2H3JX14_WOLCO|nr:protein serine/threonine phosphatase 2C [Wolfiporia cocos MD-104 SS10]
MSPNDTNPDIASAQSSHNGTDMALPAHLSFKCAVTDSKGARRTMEDAHSIVVPFGGVRGQGFFSIFDGHAGKQAADWCGANFATCLLHMLRESPALPIPDVLNQTFHEVDHQLSQLCDESDGKMHSGCTAVTAFLRLEDADGKQTFVPPSFDPLGITQEDAGAAKPEDDEGSVASGSSEESKDGREKEKKGGGNRLKNALKAFGEKRSASPPASPAPAPATPAEVQQQHERERAWTPPEGTNVRRVLYCANAGDARGVLCRGGRALRLTYDHKGSDRQEARRVVEAGGFVMSGRVNGVLNVTRSLGDSSMKEYVVGAPYTTETELTDEDEFLILACDGLWDVVDDQAAVELVRAQPNPTAASEFLLDYALHNYSTDNITVLVVRFRNPPESVVAAENKSQNRTSTDSTIRTGRGLNGTKQ